ncbi:galactolipase DONGLE, chloroplastic [Canna indica]|uniref:Galactolipase DONGLE, chloroplastic n=1 Tax=Canna indica TaxID=4628 RepID=A0AAQ3QD70_9LILI|nr:galactolipase DONGLE, chloroplastic [Canna indica]
MHFFFSFLSSLFTATYVHAACTTFDMASPMQVPNHAVFLPELATHHPRPSTSTASFSVSPRRATAAAAPGLGAVVAKCRPRWREIQGCNNWEGLVEPLSPLLCAEIVRYGEFVVAYYKAFDLNPGSKRYLNCKYGKRSLLREVGMGSAGYEITKYIYATPDISIPTQAGTCRSRWIGYTAVSSAAAVGRRDILVALRGTVTSTEWLANFMSSLTPARLDPGDPRAEVNVESGFLGLYTSDDSSCRFSSRSCREQLLAEVLRIMDRYREEELSITLAGHSMGSSLALLFGYDLAELGLNQAAKGEIPITVYSFGGPRVGNLGFRER